MTEKKQTIYGDEKLGYKVLVRDMTSKQAQHYLICNENDEIIEQTPSERRNALIKKMEEGGLKLDY